MMNASPARTSPAIAALPADIPAALPKSPEAECCSASFAPYFSRSQAHTYTIATTKNPSVHTAKTMSRIALTPSPHLFGEGIDQNFTRIARFSRFSIFRRSGVNPGTKAPGDPQILLPITGVGQDVGVMPPCPEK